MWRVPDGLNSCLGGAENMSEHRYPMGCTKCGRTGMADLKWLDGDQLKLICQCGHSVGHEPGLCAPPRPTCAAKRARRAQAVREVMGGSKVEEEGWFDLEDA